MTTDIETMWHEHHNGLYAYMFKRLRDRDIADDLLSALYLRVVVAIRNGNGPTSSVHGWLFAIARSVLGDHWRAKKRSHFVPIDTVPEIVDGAADLDETIERQLTTEVFHRAMGGLPERQMDVIHMKLLGYTNLEISEAMQISEQAAKALNTRAFRTLRERLQAVAA